MRGIKEKCEVTYPKPSITAGWDISLDCNCPQCEEWVDLFTADDFWEGKSFDIGESGTERTRNVKVNCPQCMHEFEVDLEY